ncbi:MAG TPA: OmpA family protein [Flavobacterium sp.]|nr:OmpA family protein [Flavobacterium sp.]
MKKILLILVFAFAINTINAQNETIETKEIGFNKWSFELAAGFNKPQKPMTYGYFTSIVSTYTVDLGARYMFNNKFGLKADFGFNSFTGEEDSMDFDSQYYRVDLQGVANIGRMMNFETWTKTIGLLGHAGFGLSYLESKDYTYVKDNIGNFIIGVTGQIKLTDKIVLTGDFTTLFNAKQDWAFDGASKTGITGFSGLLFNGTAGITVYLGKNAKHADWVMDNDDRFKEINDRFIALENRMIDSDKDGVANYLDEEAETPAGTMVDTKGRSIDKNNNKVADETEAYVLKNYASKTDGAKSSNYNDQIKSTINNGYICTYFDFNESKPNNTSTEGIDFILTYLRNNPSASVDIIGHADEVGKSEYNDKLANARATNVKNILLKANINPSRLNVVSAGEDTSVDKTSEGARKLVRKVTFMIK